MSLSSLTNSTLLPPSPPELLLDVGHPSSVHSKITVPHSRAGKEIDPVVTDQNLQIVDERLSSVEELGKLRVM